MVFHIPCKNDPIDPVNRTKNGSESSPIIGKKRVGGFWALVQVITFEQNRDKFIVW